MAYGFVNTPGISGPEWDAQHAAVLPTQAGTLTYTGLTQSPVWYNYDPRLLDVGGTLSAANAGTYEATFTPTPGHKWWDGTTEAKTVEWTIGKASAKLKLSRTSVTFTPHTGESTPPIEVYAVRDGSGAITADSNDIARVSVYVEDATIVIGQVVPAMMGTTNVHISVAADENHNAASADITVATFDEQP